MAEYGAIRNELKGLTEEIKRMGDLRDSQRLDLVSEKIESEIFNLVILGQFKRGKSTLINALLGEKVLPSAIVPLTSVVTIVCYGDFPGARVNFMDGTNTEIAIEDIHKYATEKKNPKNRLNVREVEVFYPSDYLKKGVRLVDTPGVGSVFAHNTDVAYRYLPNADAGIFVVTPDPPPGESEHKFLKEIRGHIDKVFFVLNKIDQVNGEDLAEAEEFTARLLQEDLGKKVEIHPVSAAKALCAKEMGDTEMLAESGLPEFEKKLSRFLMREKGKVFLKSVISSLLKELSNKTMSCKLEQEAARLSIDELKTKIAAFEKYAKDTQKDREQQGFILEGRVKNLYEKIDSDLENLKKKELPVLLKKMEKVFSERIDAKISAHDLEKTIEEFVFNAIKEIFSDFRLSEAEAISSELEKIYIDIAGQTNLVIENIVKMTADLFAIDISPFTSIEKLSKKSDFYFLLKDDPCVIELIRLSVAHALPAVFARGRILKRMKDTVTSRFERHCGRVRYDLVRRIDDTTRKFKSTFNEKIDLTLDTIRHALDRAVAMKDKNEHEIKETMSELSSRLSGIASMQTRLKNLEREADSLGNGKSQ